MKLNRFLSLLAVAMLLLSCGSKENNDPDDNGSSQGGGSDTPAETDEVEVAGPTTWALVDELGRTIPTDAPDASTRTKKKVILFYWTWHCQSQVSYKRIVNVSEVIRNHPEALNEEVNPDTSYDDPVWGTWCQPCFWGKPLFDYYRTTDEWVLRKHAEMLADAGVDAVFFDCTNGHFTWMDSTNALLKVWAAAKKDGVNVPQIGFLLPFGATDDSLISLRQLYEDIYKPGAYKDLWFKINNKPVLMAYNSNLTSSDEDKAIKNFFTFRPGQPDYVNGPSTTDQWGWLEVYPQHLYGKSNELMPVGVAQNTNLENGGHCYAFNAPGSYGRSFTKQNGQDESENAYYKGLNFQEQWDYALKKDPTMVFVTGWNEWIAGRQPNWPSSNPYKPFAFPDEYDSERSRDIEPTAEWGDYGDIYYCQFIENIRKYKGVEKYPKVSEKKTVKIGSFDGWDKVSPDFEVYANNTFDRYHPQHSSNGKYNSNKTGRNDFSDARVARDDDNIYFYVTTSADITESTGKAWMRLFINIDRSVSTGWKGYDFCLNMKNPSSATEGTVSKCSGTEWNWEDAGTFEYALSGNKMEIKVPRSVLGATGKLDFEFKWSDNMQEDGNILDFYVNGDCAPLGRFNFVYTAE